MHPNEPPIGGVIEPLTHAEHPQPRTELGGDDALGDEESGGAQVAAAGVAESWRKNVGRWNLDPIAAQTVRDEKRLTRLRRKRPPRRERALCEVNDDHSLMQGPRYDGPVLGAREELPQDLLGDRDRGPARIAT